MTPRDSDRPETPGLPRFSAPRGGNYSLTIKPPFSFTGVTNLLFPLRASLDSLQRFCNNYLNIVPPEIGRFRAPVPYVYLMLLDYGRMAIDVANVGWLAQREILFCIPLEWYKVVNGQWVFHDWATIAPFIYVDDDMSMNVGRNVYGWPKATAKMTPTLSTWIQNPLSPINEATVSTAVFPELYTNQRLEQRVFLEVDRAAPMSNLRYPLDTSSPMAPWTLATNLAEAMAGLSRDALGMMSGMGVMPMHPGSSAANYSAMMEKLIELGFPLRPNLLANTINLKQFRQSDEPDRFCYQALTNGPMRYTALNRAGMLGEDRIMLGDVTGGFSIKLHEWPSLPIIDTLGLQVSRRWRGKDANIAELKPVAPMWYDVNMTYLPGSNLAWRTRDGEWHDASGTVVPVGAPDQAESVAKAALFNTTLGAGNKTVAGPFHFAGSAIRVLPLLAYREKLEQFIDGYLNKPLAEGNADARFRLWAPPTFETEFAYVYLTATSFDDVTSGTDNVGDWADAELAFLVPVQWEERREGTDEWTLKGVGVVPAFTYLDSVTAASARSEVLGIPATVAVFGKPSTAWMTQDGPDEEVQQTLLRMEAEVLPVVGEGQKAHRRTILRITAGHHHVDAEGLHWRQSADRWGTLLKGELQRKKRNGSWSGDFRRGQSPAHQGRALALELLGNGVPLSLYTLKQVRDVVDPNLACFQSIVRVRRTLTEVLDLREIERPLTVHVQEFPTQPLVDLLGLVGKEVRDVSAGITYALHPVRPFWMRVTMDEALGEPLLSRSGAGAWKKPDAAAATPTWYFDDAWVLGSGAGAGWIRDMSDPRRLNRTLVGEKTFTTEFSTAIAQKVNEARDVVGRIDPQTVIESILSREWGSWNEDARWLTRRRDLVRGIAMATEGLDWQHHVPATIKYLIDDQTKRGSMPGQRPMESRRELIETSVRPVATMLTKIEETWAHLVRLGAAYEEHQKDPSRKSPDQYRRQTDRQLPALITELIAGLHEIEGWMVDGVPTSPERPREFASRTNSPRLRELMEGLKQLERAAQQTDTDAEHFSRLAHTVRFVKADALREAVSLARERYQLQLDAILNVLCRDAQKPDHVVRRDAAGTEAARVYPIEESWDNVWYAGPEPERATGFKRGSVIIPKTPDEE